MSRLPVLFFHMGYQPYLDFAIAQARAAMPGSRILLIGDHYNRGKTMAEHFPFVEYAGQATVFASHYRHRSSNPFMPELRCFQRWYAFLELMDELGLTDALVCDSDVMLYHDFSGLPRDNPDTACALSVPLNQEQCRWVACPHVAYWKRETLREFCDFNTALFQNDDPRLEAKWQLHVKQGQVGGVCDMTTLYLFYDRLPENQRMNLLEVRDQAVVDGNIGSSENRLPDEFLMSKGFRKGVKKVCFRQGRPYGCHLPSGEEVLMQALHCQGSNKWLMPHCYQGRTSRLTPKRIRVFARYGLRRFLHF